MRAAPTTIILAALLWPPLVVCARAQPAESTPPRSVTATRLLSGDAIDLDGRLLETFWTRTDIAADFVQQDPENGAPATERTEVRVAYDARRLLLGVTCLDSEPSRLLGNQMQRDQPLTADDRFMISIDPHADGRSGYFFQINPSGAMGDGLVTSSAGGGGQQFNNVNMSWDGIWMARVARTPAGWTAEIEIPFRTLYFDPASSAWGINFQRTVRRRNEESLWNGWPRNQGLTLMAAAGRLTGLDGLSQGIGLDLRPYAAATSVAAPGRGIERVDNSATFGGDVIHNLTPNLRANFTINTDFAETEVDQRQINLTRFPLFFPEKRTFFLEGSSFFEFAREPGNTILPFFSRRIGLDDRGVPQPIDYGVKLTGQVGAFDVGALQLRTRDTSSNVGEPLDSLALARGEQFTVVRVRRRMLAQSFIGGIYTRRGGGGPPDRHTAGVDVALSTTHFRGDDVLEVSGFWLRTTPAAALCEPRRESCPSSAYGMRIDYPNDPLNFRLGISQVGAGYDPAVGFVDRRGYRRVNPAVRFIRHTITNPIVRRYSFEADVDLRFDPEGRLETRRPDLQALRLELQSGDFFELHLFPLFERLPRDFPIFGAVTLPAGSTYTFFRRQYQVRSAGRRLVSVNGQYEDGSFYSGSRRQVTGTVNLRPRSGVLLGMTADYNDVDLREGRFSTTLWRGDASTQFGPWISLAQVVQYDTVSRALGWQARFRWIEKPGNDWFFVYTHNWIDRERLVTFDRRAAAKVVRTIRF